MALAALRAQMADVPVIGVIGPGATAAVAAKPAGKHLVLATEATVGLCAYRTAISERDPGAEIQEQACEMLVSLAEEGWSNGDIARAIVRRYLDEAAGGSPDTIILGCTHFPLLKDTIRDIAGDGIVVVDSASTTARVVREVLETGGMTRKSDSPGSLRLLATD